jgi:uncharacterized protein (TIGR03000 family)
LTLPAASDQALVSASRAAPATITVRLPADAKLMIDGSPTKADSAVRVFTSPTLDSGRAYTYELSASRLVDGTPQTVNRTVEVRAGRETSVTIDFPTAAVARR